MNVKGSHFQPLHQELEMESIEMLESENSVESFTQQMAEGSTSVLAAIQF